MSDIEDRIRELWAQGLSLEDIGARLGKSRASIVGYRARLKLPPHPSVVNRAPPGSRKNHHKPKPPTDPRWRPGPTPSHHFTDAENAAIRDLRTQGYGWQRIGDELGGLSVDIMRRQARVLGLIETRPNSGGAGAVAHARAATAVAEPAPVAPPVSASKPFRPPSQWPATSDIGAPLDFPHPDGVPRIPQGKVTLAPSYHKRCQFLIGPDTGTVGRYLPFCDAPTVGGSSYCQIHRKVCMVRVAA